jgi:hypothetical protein
VIAAALPPVVGPQLAPKQKDSLVAMRLSVNASAGVRDFAMTGNDASLTQAIPTLEAMGELVAPYSP